MRVARVIPCLDVTNGRVVKGDQLRRTARRGRPVELAAKYDRDGADELVFLDITASSDGGTTMIDVVGEPRRRCSSRSHVGGGSARSTTLRAMLRAVRQGQRQHGRRRAAGADPDIARSSARSAWCARSTRSGEPRRRLRGVPARRPHADRHRPVEWAARAWRGAGEILLTSMDRTARGRVRLELTPRRDACRAGDRERWVGTSTTSLPA
jgi:cyclase